MPGESSPSHLEADDAFGHYTLELSAVPDITSRIPEVLLADVLDLRHDVRGHEPASAQLPAIGACVDACRGELAMRAIEAGADEERLARQEAIDRIDRVLFPDPCGELG